MVEQRYNTPSKGTTDWHIPLNENFDQLNLDIELRDTDAKIGNYAPSSGRKFFSCDTGNIYIGDGNKWNFIGNVPSHPANVYVQADEPTNASEGDLWITPP